MSESPMRAMSLHALMSAAGTEARLRKPEFVTNDSEDLEPACSLDLLKAFSTKHAELGQGFLDSLSTTWEEIFADSEPYYEISEPPAVHVVTDEMREKLGDYADELAQRKPPWTKPVWVAFKATSKEAKEANQNASAGRIVQLMLSDECSARDMLLAKYSADTLDQALLKIDVSPTEAPSLDDMMANFRESSRRLIDRTWPSIREQSRSDKADAFKDKHFADNPAYYQGRVNLAEHLSREIPEGTKGFSVQVGGCLHAAENEARMRNAPERTLDHMFFSLLQEGLDTTKFLESRGIDWRIWREELDSAIPTFVEEGPRFPPSSRDLGMNQPWHELSPPMPVLPSHADEGAFDAWENSMKARPKRPRQFSDLLWLIGCLNEPDTLGFKYLTRAGIKKEDIEAVTDSTF